MVYRVMVKHSHTKPDGSRCHECPEPSSAKSIMIVFLDGPYSSAHVEEGVPDPQDHRMDQRTENGKAYPGYGKEIRREEGYASVLCFWKKSYDG